LRPILVLCIVFFITFGILAPASSTVEIAPVSSRTFTITDSGMEPAVMLGATVVCETVPLESLKVGDIIIYRDQESFSKGIEKPLIARVVEIISNRPFVKPDASTSQYSMQVSNMFFIGKVTKIENPVPAKPHTSFSPDINGFSFSNNDFTEKEKKSLIDASVDISNDILQSPIGSIVPPEFYQTVADLANQLAMLQQGYCGGIVLTAKQYYENPSNLPNGYSNAHSISGPSNANVPQETRDLIWHNQWINQYLSNPGILKYWSLSLGNAPSGLVPFNDEVNWIIKQLDQGKTVTLSLFQEDPWYLSHAVLAYDYLKSSSGNDLYIYVYGPNYGNQPNKSGTYYATDSKGGQTIHLTRDEKGNYAIANGKIELEGFRFFRLGASESPLGVNWGSLVSHIGDIALGELGALSKLGLSVSGIEANCPVTLMLTTPTGLHIGFNSTTQTVQNDIGSAFYSGPAVEPQILALIDYTVGTYSLDITGNGIGPFAISSFQLDSSGNIKQNLTYTGTTYQNKIDHLAVQLNDNRSIPEFSTIPLIVFTLTMATTALILRKRAHHTR
jgi:hypothetical protein